MKKNTFIRTVMVALGISMALVSTGFAVQMEGNYLSSNIGMTYQPVIIYSGIHNSTTTGERSLKIEGKPGMGFDSAYGYQTEDLRVEGSIVYLQNKIKKAVMRSPNFEITGGNASDNTTAMGLMINGMYDFDSEANFIPYIGVGLGMVKISHKINSFPVFSATTTTTTTTTITLVTPPATVPPTVPTPPTTDKTQVTTNTSITPAFPLPPNVLVTNASYSSPPVITTALTPPALPPTYGSSTTTGSVSTSTVTSANGSKVEFAGQLILGVSYQLTDDVKAAVDYRYLRAASTHFTVMDAGVPTTMAGSYSNHRLTLGVTAFL
jgi:opacity protein-like surface antigen